MKNNNLKKIRELYGATQDQIAKVAGVNRSTVSQWENGASQASESKLEKLSFFYGIGPEVFYDQAELSDAQREVLMATAKREAETSASSEQTSSKTDELAKLFQELSFEEVKLQFTVVMKLLLATTDQASIEELEFAHQINDKMAQRLKNVIEMRKKEQEEAQSLLELLDS